MATYTSHYNLTKPEGTERVNIAIINQNMDAIDTQMYKNAQSIIANHGGMAIPSNNNTHAAVSSGQYVYVYNHSSLAEGLYVAKSAISTNGALSLSNLTAVSGGGLNHVYSTLNSNITNLNNHSVYKTGGNMRFFSSTGNKNTIKIVLKTSSSYWGVGFIIVEKNLYTVSFNGPSTSVLSVGHGGTMTASWDENTMTYTLTSSNGGQIFVAIAGSLASDSNFNTISVP